MIHIATVHWKADKWIDIQLKYFEEYILEDFQIYACLNYIESDHSKKFHYCNTEDIQEHAIKLNFLGSKILEKSNDPSDLLIFIDGDAFPITNIMEQLKDLLKQYPLVAVRRIVEDGDLQPHPSFCATTVGFWEEINGDWREGYTWKNKRNEITTDVGGNLFGELENNSIRWYQMDRSNKINLHPILYGVYNNMIYHHGAGFREPIFRSSKLSGPRIRAVLQKFILKVTTKKFRQIFSPNFRNKLKSMPKAEQFNKDISKLIYHCIRLSPSFIKDYFLSQENTL
ncbi:MAG: hypothetical protein ACJA01_002513 [Saprospiraceae bacterium]|jgi:hypothetical protein